MVGYAWLRVSLQHISCPQGHCPEAGPTPGLFLVSVCPEGTCFRLLILFSVWAEKGEAGAKSVYWAVSGFSIIPFWSQPADLSLQLAWHLGVKLTVLLSPIFHDSPEQSSTKQCVCLSAYSHVVP